jgi:D-arginine dehydrogenase
MRIVIIGGGIAGLAAAAALGRVPGAELVLLEREPLLCAHSSSRNAAIYRTVEIERPVAELAVRNATLLDALIGRRDGWLRENELLLTAHARDVLVPLAEVATALGIEVRWLEQAELLHRAPALDGGRATTALCVPGAGVIDIHAIARALARHVIDAGGAIHRGRSAERVVTEAGRVRGVVSAGDTLAADVVVIAGGAWASALGETCGAPLPLVPVRRHLVVLAPEAPPARDAPTVWDVELGSYFRPEGTTLLASPGDAVPWPAELPAADPKALELLEDRLATMAPSLVHARVRRSWACLRTFAPDRTTVVGADPRVAGLFWLAGLGGHGMSTGVAAGDVLRAAVTEQDDALVAALSPARLIT